jgi:hypothetical protein
MREKITERFDLSACLLWFWYHQLYVVLMEAIEAPLSLIVVVLMASFVKPTGSFIVLILLDVALVSLTWPFSGHSPSVLVLMAALLKLPLSLIFVVLMASFVKPTGPLVSYFDESHLVL